MKIYIGGPITNAIEKGIFNIEIKRKILNLIDIFENYKVKVFSAHKLEDFGLKIPNKNEDIVNRDLSLINMSNIFCCYLPTLTNKSLRTDGTYIELGFALAKNLPIIVIVDNLQNLSPMLLGLVTKGVNIIEYNLVDEKLSTILSKIESNYYNVDNKKVEVI